MFYVVFLGRGVIPRRLNCMCRHFRTLCLFHPHRTSEQEEKQTIQHSQCGKSLKWRRYRLKLVLHGEWSVISTKTDMQCSCLFETYLHDHSHRCAPPYRLVGVFSVQGWWHRSYCGAGRCHTCTHIHHEADPLLFLPGVSTLPVETKQSVSNKTQATRDKCWTVCTSEDSTVHYLSWYKQMIPCMVFHQFILIQPVTQPFIHISITRVFFVMCKRFFKILQWQELVLSCVHSAASVTAFKIPFLLPLSMCYSCLFYHVHGHSSSLGHPSTYKLAMWPSALLRNI